MQYFKSTLIKVVLVITVTRAASTVRYGAGSARPKAPTTDENLNDSADNTCADFEYNASGTKFTKVRLTFELPMGLSAIKLTGYTMGCESTPASLYLMPLASADTDRWDGQFARCRLMSADPESASPQSCWFSCDCPGGCSNVQVVHIPNPSSLNAWKLCHITIDRCASSPCLHGGTCVDGQDSYSCLCVSGYNGDQCQNACRATVMGLEYRGDVSITSSGLTCQRWDRNFPHFHERNDPSVWPRAVYNEANFCRNPDEDPSGVWCYTTSPHLPYEYCDVPMC